MEVFVWTVKKKKKKKHISKSPVALERGAKQKVTHTKHLSWNRNKAFHVLVYSFQTPQPDVEMHKLTYRWAFV